MNRAQAIMPSPIKTETIYVRHFDVLTDTETAKRVGADGIFQVVQVTDEDGNDVTDALGIDVGHHYKSEDRLAKDIAEAFGISVEEISLDVE